jgi:predicted glycogen debranching enzyme
MAITLDKKHLGVHPRTSTFEWLETNGIGGYSSSSITGINTRKYHGLLVASLKPPVDRVVLLNRLEETIYLNDGRSYPLFSNQFPGAVSPNGGFEYLKKFERGTFPKFIYEFDGFEIEKTIVAIHGENTVVIEYEVIKAPKEFYLDLRPFISYRDIHGLTHANDGLKWDYVFNEDTLVLSPYSHMPNLFIKIQNSKFTYMPGWYSDFEYLIELDRGMEFKEDLFSHGQFSVKMKKGDKTTVIASTRDVKRENGTSLIEKEQARRDGLYAGLDVCDDFTKTMTLAADQFVVKRGENLKTIIAGYHWFSDWGRDTMISLPGLCLTTKRFEDARQILKVFAKSVSQGMLPNRFPDSGEEPEYNTVDATLWYFIAIYEYYLHTKDLAFIEKELLPTLEEIIEWHYKGTRHNIIVDPEDGLLYSGEQGVQLTWMDAKVGDWVVTPRIGKPVEINALWYNTLKIMEFIYGQICKKEKSNYFSMKAETCKNSFNKVYWNPEKNTLYDCVGDYINDDAIRPNAAFALSLPFTLLDDAKAKKVLKSIETHLLMPYGLRSLSPEDSHYRSHYFGNQWSRDGSYHQGTAWSWLLGPYYFAKMKLEGEAGKEKVLKHIEKFKTHLKEAGIGTVSEIFDADQPYKANGCIAQAWGVAEVLRAYVAAKS